MSSETKIGKFVWNILGRSMNPSILTRLIGCAAISIRKCSSVVNSDGKRELSLNFSDSQSVEKGRCYPMKINAIFINKHRRRGRGLLGGKFIKIISTFIVAIMKISLQLNANQVE